MSLHLPTTAEALSRRLNATLVGDPGARVEAVASLESAGPGALSFYASARLRKAVENARGAVVLTKQELVDPQLPLTFLVVRDPQLAFAGLTEALRPLDWTDGIHPTAVISSDAKLGPGVSVGAFACVGERAVIGAGTVVMAYAYVGPDVVVGESCEIHPRATLLTRISIGNRVKILSGAVIGSEGFGFVPGDNGLVAVPQIGTVVIEDDVRVGALSTIDRATLGETRIGRGTKIDNLVHVAHNCRIGRDNVLCAQSGIAGSATLEDDVMLGGQAGVADHAFLGRGARLAAQSGTNGRLKGKETYFGSPALPMSEWRAMFRALRRLPKRWAGEKDREGEKA